MSKPESFNVLRLVLPAGKTIPEYQASKEITVQCVRGRVDFETMGQTQAMTPGPMIYRSLGAPHALTAAEDSIMVSRWRSSE